MSTGYKLFLDDLRSPSDIYPDSVHNEFVIVRNYEEFTETVLRCGVPNFISFDNDLGCDIEGEPLKEGYDCAKWLIFESGLDLNQLYVQVHSANPVARKNIEFLFRNYFKHLGDSPDDPTS